MGGPSEPRVHMRSLGRVDADCLFNQFHRVQGGKGKTAWRHITILLPPSVIERRFQSDPRAAAVCLYWSHVAREPDAFKWRGVQGMESSHACCFVTWSNSHWSQWKASSKLTEAASVCPAAAYSPGMVDPCIQERSLEVSDFGAIQAGPTEEMVQPVKFIPGQGTSTRPMHHVCPI